MRHVCLILITLLAVFAALAQTPQAPQFTLNPFDSAVLITWDSLAQSSGLPFSGYHLYRGRSAGGPFTLIRTWAYTPPAPIVHSFYDIGDDNGDGVISQTEGLHNQLTYYYCVTAYVDSVSSPYSPYMESPIVPQAIVPHATSTNFAPNQLSLSGQTGISGDIAPPQFVITNPGNFRSFFEGHSITVSYTTLLAGNTFLFPVTITDVQSGLSSYYFINPGLVYTGDSAHAGTLQGTLSAENVLGLNSFLVEAGWKFIQRATPLQIDTLIRIQTDPATDTPVYFRDTTQIPYVGLIGADRTLGESTYEIDFLPGGVDSVRPASKQWFNYLNLKVTETNTGRVLQLGVLANFQSLANVSQWGISSWAFNTKSTNFTTRLGADKYYLSTPIDSTTVWEFSNVLVIENTRIVFDYADKGRGPARNWPLASYKATKDFQAGDKIQIVLTGGVGGKMPYQAVYTYLVNPAALANASSSVLNQIRVVPNPYLIQHEAQQSASSPTLRFDYLPEVCEIRIYSISLNLIKVLHHQGGGQEFWDMTNSAGKRIGSQMLIAYISAPGGGTVIKKFSVILGE